MRPIVLLTPHTYSYAGQNWHACTVTWSDQILYRTGLYRDPQSARENAMRYVDVLRADVA